MTNTTPNLSSIYYTGTTKDDKTNMTVNNTTCNLKYPHPKLQHNYSKNGTGVTAVTE